MTTKIQTFGGNIGIGTTDPGGFKLNVHGSLKTSSLVVNGVTDAQVPIGLLGMWSGSLVSIPSGWALCDGGTYTRTDGEGSIDTPDLRDRFIRGADGDSSTPVAVGSSGGGNTVTLSVANLAPHSHTVNVSPGNANHNHNTAENTMAHDHGETGTTQTPHDHGETGTTNTPHNHGTSGVSSPAPHSHSALAANMPHSHNTQTINAPHRHYVTYITNRSSRAGVNFSATRTQGTTNSFGANAGGPHSHIGFQTSPNQQHAHGCPTADATHDHGTGSEQWQHSHSLIEVNANHSHNTGDGNAAHTHSVPAVYASHSHTATSNNTGQGTAFSVLNTYYALFYIMKI